MMDLEHLHKREAEGGCGVIGLASTMLLSGRYLHRPLSQMHNRGNGKGGGIAAVGCFPDYYDHYALQVGYLDEGLKEEVEGRFIKPYFRIDHEEKHPDLGDYRNVPGLEIKPPGVIRYFIRVRPDILEHYTREKNWHNLDAAEDQFVYENSFNLNRAYYSGREEKGAFVLSHGKNMCVLKGVGYAEDLLAYYRMEDFKAHVWIGHQRYPTRGRVWHPGGAHPFIGLNEALVHNGDLANYYSVSQYLSQKGIHPLFLTDTEVAALLFDYYSRTLGYDLELVIEALAPTTERDFDLLPKYKQRLYRAVRAAHIHGSPDGPWFFIIARSLPPSKSVQLIGITDTSMLRPHVFALVDGQVKLGMVASEKQAIDAILEDISADDPRVCPVADKYWISRGGSHTDGGAFSFTVDGDCLKCLDKFGQELVLPPDMEDFGRPIVFPPSPGIKVPADMDLSDGRAVYEYLSEKIRLMDYADFLVRVKFMTDNALEDPLLLPPVIEALTMLYDRVYHPGGKKRNWLRAILDRALQELFSSLPSEFDGNRYGYVLVNWTSKNNIPEKAGEDLTLVIDAAGFPQEGRDSVSRLIVSAYNKGFMRFICFNLKGDRFIGCGLGPKSHGVRIDVYGSSGDYIGSGLDGAEIYIHGDAQDQVGQILNDGRIVIYGDVGQTFLYGAKGGEVYVMGGTAGRPLINSVGTIRAIINSTCLDYAAESFMAGSELGGGFILINGLRANAYGEFMGLEDKFPGSNFFSLASGGAGYLNDPYNTVTEAQLNGGEFVEFGQDDWNFVLPYLRRNEEFFGIRIDRDILTVDGTRRWPGEVFRKVVATRVPGKDILSDTPDDAAPMPARIP